MSLTLSLWIAANPAHAQEAQPYGFDAHGFRFVTADPDPRAPLRFWRPSDGPPLGWSVGAVAEYASRPLVFESDEGTRFVASSNLAAVNVAAGFTPLAGLRFDLSAPVVLTNTSGGVPDPFGGDYATTGGGPTLADLRLGVVGAPLRPGADRDFGVGLVAALDLPTGSPERWLGTRGPAALVGALGTFEADRLTTSAQVAARLAPNSDPAERPAPTIGGDTLELQGGASWLFDPALGVGLEVSASLPLDAQVRAALSVPAEATLTGRYLTASGGHLAAGLGVGLGAGAGASPFRLVVGGGFGSAVETTPKDTDADGFADKVDPCPIEAENPNGYKDEDGCVDVLPRAVVGAQLSGVASPEAAYTLTRADGQSVSGTGVATIEGLPGDKVHVRFTLGACRVADGDIVVPMDGEAKSELTLRRAESSVLLSVFDATGRPLDTAQVRYIVDEEACRPTETALKAGRGTHVLGTGPVKLFVTALGYDVYQTNLTLVEGKQELVEVKLKSTSVSLKDGRVKMNAGLQFAAGAATLDARSTGTVQQVASVLLSQDPAPRVEIAAWADGKDAKKLSQQRADAVKELLVSFGVAADKLTVVGKGALPRDQKDVVVMSILP